MKPYEVQKLKHGIYRIYWKSGGSSLASVGSMYSGKRWIAPTNWVANDRENKCPSAWGEIWNEVEKVKKLL